MTRRLAVSIVLVAWVAAFGSAGQAQGKDQKPKSAIDVTGKWTMTMEMSMGTATPALDLKQDGETISGSYTGRYGSYELHGTLKDRAIRFSFVMGSEGQTVTMTFAGEVAADGQAMKGTADLGEMGEASWSAKREGQEAAGRRRPEGLRYPGLSARSADSAGLQPCASALRP